MKTCNRCGVEKSLTDFNKKRASGVQPYCKPCQREYQQGFYEGNRLVNLEVIYESRKKRKVEIRKFLANYYENNPCVDCGETDILVLEFDHVTGKEFGLNQAIRDVIPVNRIIEELKKGDVRCANCHRRLTAENGNSWRWRYKNGIDLSEEREYEDGNS